MIYYNEYDFLEHHGIKGQKWGVRRFQNPDGTLTAAGRKRLGKVQKKTYKTFSKANKRTHNETYRESVERRDKAYQTLSSRSDAKEELRSLIKARKDYDKAVNDEYSAEKRLAKEKFGLKNPEDVFYSRDLSEAERKAYNDEYNKKYEKLIKNRQEAFSRKQEAGKAFSKKLFNTEIEGTEFSIHATTEQLENLLKQYENIAV